MTRFVVVGRAFLMSSMVLLLAQPGMPQPDPYKLYEHGLVAAYNGDFSSAQRVLTEVSRFYPNDTKLAAELALASDCVAGKIPKTVALDLFISLGKEDDEIWEDALDHARVACGRAPDYSLAHMIFGSILRSMFEDGDRRVRPKDFIDECRKAVELDPTSGLCHYHLALAYLATGSQSKARDHLKLAESYGIQVPQELSSRYAQFLGPTSFFRGLVGPLSFIVKIPRILFAGTPEGSSTVDELLGGTWGRGGSWYRVGFVVGTIIIFSVPLLLRIAAILSRGR